jgi:4'-phosphopantetheinyl transferase
MLFSAAMEIVSWLRPAETSTLAENSIHVWRAWLDVEAAERKRLSEFLTDDETARANRFVFPHDHDHFLVARGRLRELLGRYLNCSPRNLKFTAAKYGKLSLPEYPHLRFNVSHSHGLALYGFTLDRELGIDVEKIRPEFTGEDIAARYFSMSEQNELKKIPEEFRPLAFFLCWTRKEAYVKAHGDGLQIPLDSFDVSLTPGQPATLHSADDQRWSLQSFLPAANFAAAVIAEGKFPTVEFYGCGGDHPFEGTGA